jgi:hypothetical protein
VTRALPERLFEIAELQLAYDALAADIYQHEKIRAVVDDRLAEARARRVLIAERIRALHGAPLREDGR